MDMETFKKSIQKVSQLGYFKVEEDPDFKVNSEKKTVDITIKGTDTNRNEVQFGAGYSQLDGLFGQFQFNTRNFLGRGDTLGLQFQRGNRSNFFDVSFSEPWFLDQRMSIGGRDLQPHARLQRRRRRPRPALARREPLARDRPRAVGRHVDLLRLHGHEEPVPGLPAAGAPRGRAVRRRRYADYSGKTSSITPGYRFDSRNDPFDPSRGTRYGASVSIAGGVLGGDFSFVKRPRTPRSTFPATKASNFALNLEVGMLRPYDSQARGTRGTTTIPIFERYRIGGDRSVRGFKYGAIFPIDDQNRAFFDQNGALLGGDKFLVFNLEYVYQLAGPLKLALFFDAGNAWIEGQSVNSFEMRASAGLEMRIFLPIFQAPLRFIYGDQSRSEGHPRPGRASRSRTGRRAGRISSSRSGHVLIAPQPSNCYHPALGRPSRPPDNTLRSQLP